MGKIRNKKINLKVLKGLRTDIVLDNITALCRLRAVHPEKEDAEIVKAIDDWHSKTKE